VHAVVELLRVATVHRPPALMNLLTVTASGNRMTRQLALEPPTMRLVTDQFVETVQGLAVLKDLGRRGGSGTGLSVEQAKRVPRPRGCRTVRAAQ
jgi:hypothetical protein